jgi:hypothetical protein
MGAGTFDVGGALLIHDLVVLASVALSVAAPLEQHGS